MIEATTINTERAREIWLHYQQTHDVSSLAGWIAGIDPDSGEEFIGTSGKEIGMCLQAEGKFRPLYFVRIGSDHYVEKRGKR